VQNGCRFIATLDILKSGSHMNPITVLICKILWFLAHHWSALNVPVKIHNFTLCSPCLHKTQGYFYGFYLRRLLALCSVQILVEVWLLFIVRHHTVLIQIHTPTTQHRRMKCVMISINTEKLYPAHRKQPCM